MCDSKGVLSVRRKDLNPTKARFATSRDVNTLEEAVKGADVFLGLSVADVLTSEMVQSMAKTRSSSRWPTRTRKSVTK